MSHKANDIIVDAVLDKDEMVMDLDVVNEKVDELDAWKRIIQAAIWFVAARRDGIAEEDMAKILTTHVDAFLSRE